MTGPKEKVYDDVIAPLMSQIIEACHTAKINMFSSFQLDGDLRCTTALPVNPTDEDGHGLVSVCTQLARKGWAAAYGLAASVRTSCGLCGSTRFTCRTCGTVNSEVST